jgi:hypothetical protein
MSKPRAKDPEIADEYDFSQGKRGVFYARARRGIRLIPRPEPVRKDTETAKKARPSGD